MTGHLIVLAAASAGVAAACLLPSRRTGVAPHLRQLVDPAGGGSVQPSVFGPVQPTGAAAAEGLTRFRAALALGAGLGVAMVLGGWLGVGLGTAAAVAMWRTVGTLETPRSRRRREQLTRDLPHVVDLLGCCLAAGAATSAAVDLVAGAVETPMREELRMVGSRLAMGVPAQQVWADVARHGQLGALGRSLVRAMDSGASVSDAMHRLADDLRRTAGSEVEGRARSVGAKSAAPLGLCLLPAFVLIGVVPLVAGSLAGILSL